MSDLFTYDLFTYGSLMYPEVMEALVGARFSNIAATLRDHVRREISGKPYPGIRPERGGSVDGVLYLDLDDRSLGILDLFEGVWYSRERVRVETTNGTRTALVYLMSGKGLSELTEAEWNRTHFETAAYPSYLERCRSLGKNYRSGRPAA